MPLLTIRRALLGGRLGSPRFCQPLLNRQFIRRWPRALAVVV
jgi:hypothetical protein